MESRNEQFNQAAITVAWICVPSIDEMAGIFSCTLLERCYISNTALAKKASFATSSMSGLNLPLPVLVMKDRRLES
jgi:hypothetical protein